MNLVRDLTTIFVPWVIARRRIALGLGAIKASGVDIVKSKSSNGVVACIQRDSVCR